MADNVGITPGSGAVVAADEIGGILYQRVKPTIGADGVAVDVLGGQGVAGPGAVRVAVVDDDTNMAAIAADMALLGNTVSGNEQQVDIVSSLPAGNNNIGNVDVLSLPALAPGTNNIGDVDVASLPALPAGDNNIGNVDIASALPAGSNTIGSVDVLSLPVLPAGDNNIGNVDVLTLPALPAGTNNIGDVDVASLPSLPAGTNNIGDVDIASALPSGNNNIGNVDIASSLPGGSNNIGSVTPAGTDYEEVTANSNTQTLGPTGASGDYLVSLLCTPASVSPGAVSIKDGSDAAITVFAGGNDSLSNLVPFIIAVGAVSGSGAWQVTTGDNISVVAVGEFT